MSIIRDASLSPSGRLKIQWVMDHMPLLAEIEKRFAAEKPFAGLRVTMSIHMEAKTARLALLLAKGGAEVHATGCNPLSTQDDVAAGLASMGVNVYGWHAATMQEYHSHLLAALSCKPHIVIDDGGDLTEILCDERPDLAECVLGGGEETTTGVMRLKARMKENGLPYPMICVNDAQMKYLFDNRYGTGQSVWNGINRTTNLIVAGKDVVVAGYGWCGKGCAMRAKGLGARVTVCEVNPVRAVEAAMDGFRVAKMDEAVKYGDLFVTLTGCRDIITPRHIPMMKDGAILCNAGHFDVEVAVADLRKAAVKRETARENIEKLTFADGKKIYILGEGRLVNLAAGDGHPAEIMDISFALQALCAEYIAQNAAHMEKGVYEVPEEIDMTVARLKIRTMGVEIDTLTEAQEAYIHSSGH